METTNYPFSNPPLTANAPGALAYFQKIFVSQPLFIGSTAVPFTHLAENIGVISLPADSPTAVELTRLAEANDGRGRGGVVAIDATTFEDLKKKLPFVPSLPKSQPKLQVFNPLPKPKAKPVVAVAAVAEPAKIPVVEGGPDGVGGAGGASVPLAPNHPDGLTTAKKSFKFPVIKKTNSRSLSGGVPEPEPKE